MTTPDPVADHYRTLLRMHGDTTEAAQYSSRETQERRFEMLTRIASLDGARVLDFGCGTGHLATFLGSKNVKVSYTGVDNVEEMLEVARTKHPEHRFGTFGDVVRERFDYGFVSGVFNNLRPDSRRFYQSWVRRLFELCDRGVAFNMMSSYVDYRDPGLFYERPERAFAFVKRQLTPFVVLRHDYEVKQDVVPFEFVIYAYRRPVS